MQVPTENVVTYENVESFFPFLTNCILLMFADGFLTAL